MGKRGPQATPTEQLKLRGSWRGNENPDEPSPDMLDVNYVPECLTPDEKKIWQKYFPMLHNLGLVTELDEPLLVLFCRTWVRHDRAIHDPMIKHTELASYASTILQVAAKFGMSPSDRRGVRVGAEAGKKQEKSQGKNKGRFFKKGG